MFSYCWKPTYTLLIQKNFQTSPRSGTSNLSCDPFVSWVGGDPTRGRNSLGKLVGDNFKVGKFDDGLFFVFCWGVETLNFGSMSVVVCVFKETSLNLMFFFLLRSQGRSASCCHEPHGARLSFIDFVSFWGYENHLQGQSLASAAADQTAGNLRSLPASYPRAKKVNANVANLCHGCHGIPVSHKSHNRDDHSVDYLIISINYKRCLTNASTNLSNLI